MTSLVFWSRNEFVANAVLSDGASWVGAADAEANQSAGEITNK